MTAEAMFRVDSSARGMLRTLQTYYLSINYALRPSLHFAITIVEISKNPENNSQW